MPSSDRAVDHYVSGAAGAAQRASARAVEPLFDAVVQAEGDAVRITLTGELDVASFARAGEATKEALAASAQVVLDLGGVTFMDSTGVSWLMGLRRRVTERDGSLVVETVSPAVEGVLRTLALDGLLQRS